ncbi:conserved hypothetical protein [Methanococcus vannielii SB]|uniref:Uncharacterized protein n=1 Tax=Methanococcus vannielii (strain ATCC 35089 / DSM 1224 / JCM 13029 / OCM 148 / SB) TaxID=406327 RepID=A6UPP0_METVS|nr:hypothetical protein [Methanococcus vannielii]ABR54462.1 conserved hypothetical protein [Methanococcus vannielii SB]
MNSKYIIPGIMVLLLIGAIYIALGPNIPEKYIFVDVTFKMGGAEYQGYTIQGSKITFEFKREGDFFTQAITSGFASTSERFRNITDVYIKIDTNGDINYYKAEKFYETDDVVKYQVIEK